MSRFGDYDDYEGDPEQILAMGRWQRNARATLKSKRGRKALRDIREALLALPEHRLIEGALCTVGGPARVPDVAEDAIATKIAKKAADYARCDLDWTEQDAANTARWMRLDVEEEREGVASAIGSASQGEGVCLIGAYLWHQKVKSGMDPAGAFAELPTVTGRDDDPLRKTAEIGEDAGLAYTLAWELAYRNDETFGKKTPEERWEAFVAWIDNELGEEAAAS